MKTMNIIVIKKSIIILLGFFFYTLQIEAQTVNNEGFEKNSFSGNFFGTSSVIGATYERMISDKIIVEGGIGLVGIGAGFSYYPFNIKKSKLCPYTGIKISSLVLVDMGGGGIVYIPLGLTLFTKNKVNVGMDIGPAYGEWNEANGGPGGAVQDKEPTSTTLYFYGNLKIGFRF